MGVVDTSTSRGCNFFIQSLFGALDTPLERYIQGVHISFILACISQNMLGVVEPKKHRLGPQNSLGSLGPKKTIKKFPKWKLFFEPTK
jgi:hypothetical protein